MSTKKFPMSAFFMDEEEILPHSSGISVFEEGSTVVIEAALPGLSTEDIEVSHAHGYLLIEGERKEEEKGRKYYRKATSEFFYRIPIPPGADFSAEPEAIFKDGIMRITFKKGAQKGKSIPIKEGD